MHNRASDADLVAFMRLVEKHGSASAAAPEAGIAASAARQRAREGKDRGLTAQTVIRDPQEKLKAENASMRLEIKRLQHEEETAAAIREQIWKLEAHDPAPPEWLMKEGKNGSRGMPLLFASDWHYGEVVNPKDVGGVNEFNSEIAAARVKRMTNTAIDLCFNHMGKAKTVYPG